MLLLLLENFLQQQGVVDDDRDFHQHLQPPSQVTCTSSSSVGVPPAGLPARLAAGEERVRAKMTGQRSTSSS